MDMMSEIPEELKSQGSKPIPESLPILWAQLMIILKPNFGEAALTVGFQLKMIKDALSNVRPAAWTEVPCTPEQVLAVNLSLKKSSAWRTVSDIFSIVTLFFSPVSAVSPEELLYAAEAFDNTAFIDPGNKLVGLLKRYLSKQARRWATSLILYAPYFAQINASMMGKSRTVMELPVLGVFAFVTCFRPQKSDTYRPPRTPNIADWATSPVDVDGLLLFTQQAVTFFKSCLQQLLNFLKSQKRARTIVDLAIEWRAKQQQGGRDDGVWGKVWKAMEVAAVPNRFAMKTESAPVTVAHELIQHARSEQVEIAAQIRTELQRLDPNNFDPNSIHTVFLFDEARNLKTEATDNFTLLRRASRVLAPGAAINSFCIFTDTSSAVSNFAPPAEMDPSERGRLLPDGLCAPFIWTMTLDVWWEAAKKVPIHCSDVTSLAIDARQVLEQVREGLGVASRSSTERRESADRNRCTRELVDCLSLELLGDVEFSLLMGRPAGYPNFQMRSVGVQESDRAKMAMVALLAEKLINEHVGQLFSDIPQQASEKSKQKRLSERQLLAILGALVSMEVNAASKLATELSSGNMRLVAGISSDRHLVYTVKVAEPGLALAAHELIRQGFASWEEILSAFKNSQIHTTTLPGFVGEVVVQIVCIIAWQSAILQRRDKKDAQRRAKTPKLAPEAAGRSTDTPEALCIPAIPTFEYLGVLLGASFVQHEKAEEVKAALKGGFVRVNEFVKTFSPAKQNLLFDHAVRGAGIVCKELQQGSDAIVPICCPPGESEEEQKQAGLVRETSFSALHVQVKNLGSSMDAFKRRLALDKMVNLQTSDFETPQGKYAVMLVVELFRDAAGTPICDIQVDHTKRNVLISIQGLCVADMSVPTNANTIDEALIRVMESQVDPSVVSTMSEGARKLTKYMYNPQLFPGDKDALEGIDLPN